MSFTAESGTTGVPDKPPITFDIYCIHLAHRHDRMAEIERLRSNYPSLQINIVDAVRDIDGVRGCILSHKKAVEYARSRNLPYIIVIEDDCEFLLPEEQLIHALTASINYMVSHPDVDIVNGCGNLPTMTATLVDSLDGVSFLKAPEVLTAHCIIYKQSSYESILKFPVNIPIDVHTNSLNMVFTYPYLATQLPSYSDIMNADVFYGNIRKSSSFVKNIIERRELPEASPRHGAPAFLRWVKTFR